MKNSIFKPLALLLFLATAFVTIEFYACSKDSGDNGGNNNGGGNGTGKSVSIKNFAFSVASLAVDAGTTVTWTNDDAMAHTVTADDGSFDSGNIAPGASYSHKFSAKGSFAYHCTIHPGMTATVTVN